jgi:EmrB/QacA subfamily drug resistance transporter
LFPFSEKRKHLFSVVLLNTHLLLPERKNSVTTRSATTPSEAQPTTRQWLSLIVLSLSLAIIILDASVVNVTLPAIRKQFGASLADLEWISATYAIVFGAFIITWGRLSDTFGRRRIFVAGIVTFVIGSGLIGFANSIPLIIVGRLIQGMGAAMSSPATLSILSATFTGRARNAAFGVWGATAGIGGVLGPLLGGWFTTSVTWQWAFLINIPIGLIAIVGSFLLVDESRDTSSKSTLDLVGIFLVSVGLASAIFGLTEGQTYGWLTPKQTFVLGPVSWPSGSISFSLTMFIIAVVFISIFVWYECLLLKRSQEPLFNFSLLQYPGFRFGLITVTVVALGEFGVLFILSLYLQGVRGLTAFDTGLTLLPFAIGSFITAPLAGAFASRFGPKWIVTIGMLLESLALLFLSLVIQTDTARIVFIPIFLLYGAGLGLAIAQLTSVVLSDIPPQYYGAGSGANNTLRQVGAAIGVAILGAVLASSISSTAATQLSKNTVIPGIIKPAIQKTFDAGDATSGDGRTTPVVSGKSATGGPPTGHLPSPTVIGKEIKGIYDFATTDGTRNATRVASFFVFLGALSSLLIPGRRQTIKMRTRGKEDTSNGEVPAGASEVVVVPTTASGSDGSER